MNYPIDYTPDSFNKSRAFDLRYDFEKDPADISIYLPGGFNKEDVVHIDNKVKLGDDDPFVEKRLIDMGNDHMPNGNNYNPVIYDAYVDLKKEERSEAEKTDKNQTKSVHLSHHTPTSFWLEDPRGLFTSRNYYQIIPSAHMSRPEMLNTLTRFFVYLFILFVLIGAGAEYMYIIGIAHILIVLIYLMTKIRKHERRESTEHLDEIGPFVPPSPVSPTNAQCQMPTKGNPFMNVTMDDLMENRSRPGACPVSDPTVKKQMETDYNHDLMKDVEDLFDRSHSARQFYTMPSTTIPNDQTSFARWLYEGPPTCKENQLNCLKYEDIRFNRFNPNIDRMIQQEEEFISN